jgi:hypothetical protein
MAIKNILSTILVNITSFDEFNKKYIDKIPNIINYVGTNSIIDDKSLIIIKNILLTDIINQKVNEDKQQSEKILNILNKFNKNGKYIEKLKDLLIKNDKSIKNYTDQGYYKSFAIKETLFGITTLFYSQIRYYIQGNILFNY